MPRLLRVLLPLLLLLGAAAACGGVITPATRPVYGDGQSRGGA